MSTELSETDKLVDLIRGLLVDVRSLVRQQIDLAKVEAYAEFARVRDATRGLMAAAVMLLLGGSLIPFILVDLLLYVTAFRIPEWCAGVIVAAVLVSVGWITMRRAIRRSSHAYRAIFDHREG